MAQTQAVRSENAKPGSVTGTVVNSVSQTPVRRAEVVLIQQRDSQTNAGFEPYVAETDSEGRYVIDGVRPGLYRLEIEKNGFVRYPDPEARVRPEPTAVAAGQTLKLGIELMPHAIVTGRVLDEHGEPVDGASVTVLRRLRQGKHRMLVSVGSAMTNDLGDFRVTGIYPGRRYYLAVDYHREIRTPGGEQIGYGRTYFPGVTDEASALPLTLGPGDESAASLQIAPRRAFNIRGSVVDEAAKGESRTMVLSRPAGQPFNSVLSRSSTSDNGKFEIRGVAPGRHLVVAMSITSESIYIRSIRGGSAYVDVGESDVSDVAITIGVGATIRGRISGSSVQQRKLSELTVSLQPAENLAEESGISNMFGAPSAEVQEDGTFELTEVSAGEYRVLVQPSTEGWQDSYPQSIQSGKRDVLAGPLVVAGATQPPLTIVLANDTGRITGIAKDANGKPFAGATVIGLPQGPWRHRQDAVIRDVTDRLGRFELRGAWPGEYAVLALDSYEGGFASDVEALEGFLSTAKKVRVVPHGANSLDLQVIPLPGEDEDD